MYKGIKISNSEKPNYMNQSIGATYVLQDETSFSIPPKKELVVRIRNLPEDVDLEAYFEIGKQYSYHDTVIFKTIELEEKKGLDIFGLPYYEFYDRFNYSSTEYDAFSSNLTEIELPNFYLSKRNSENDKYENLFTFDFNITSNSSLKNPYVLKNGYRERNDNDVLQMQNIFLAKDAQRYGEAEKSYFPYAVDIKLNFNDIDVTSTLLDNFNLHKSSLSIIDSLPKENVSFNVTDKNFDLEVNSVSQIPVASLEDLFDYAYFPKDGGLIYLPDNVERSRFTENLIKIQARTQYNKNATNYLPSISSILAGQLVKNEILYIKMEKYSGQNSTGVPIQNIWLRDTSVIDEDPSKSKYGIYDYYDTQVKIGQTYTYVVKAFVIIYGANITCEGATTEEARFSLSASYKIVEVEIGKKTITVLPPIQLPPFVHPFCDTTKNKVSFYLQLEQGRKFMDYILFRNTDEQYRTKIYDTSQYKKPEHAFLPDKAIFEIFRIENKPKKLSDFSNFKVSEVTRDGVKTSAVFSQNISFNKNYYYLFRSINFLRYPSNPSKVYRIKLIKGIEKNHLEVESFDILEEAENYDIEKKFTKLIHIMPNIRDTFINEQATEELNSYVESINSVQMGLNENFSVWGKRYKIRIKSNNTGKKIDLNVRFKLLREQ